jgi:hypothetical protein
LISSRTGAHEAQILARGVVQLPVQVGLAGEDRAGVAAAHGHDVIRGLDCLRRQDLRRAGGQVDADLPHRRHGTGIDLLGRQDAGGTDVDASLGEVGQPDGGHLGAAGVVDADEQDRGTRGESAKIVP